MGDWLFMGKEVHLGERERWRGQVSKGKERTSGKAEVKAVEERWKETQMNIKKE